MGWLYAWDNPTAGPLQAAVLTLVLSSLLTHTAAFGLRGGGPTECEYNSCWEQYEAAQIHYSLHLPLRSDPDPDLTPEQRHESCVVLRTYQKCMEDKSRECRSDLGFHGAQKGIEKQMDTYRCNATGEVFTMPDGPPQTPPVYVGECSYPRLANGAPPRYSHCALFGDPHLQTFGNVYQTCRVQGAWPLFSSEHLTVQVTNEFVDMNSDTATATTKLTVVIKGHTDDNCADGDRFVTYQAQKDHLPSTFDDGRHQFGHRGSVQLVEHEPGAHVEIYLSYIDTTIVVRRIGLYLTFAMRIPAELVDANLAANPDGIDLCTKSCPLSERIDYKAYLVSQGSRLKPGNDGGGAGGHGAVSLPQVAMTRDTAVAKCREAGVTDFYFDSCVFDLISTGDLNFTDAALHAYQDTLRLYPAVAASLDNRTEIEEYVDGNHAASAKSAKLSYIHRTTFVLMHVLAYVAVSNYARGRL